MENKSNDTASHFELAIKLKKIQNIKYCNIFEYLFIMFQKLLFVVPFYNL